MERTFKGGVHPLSEIHEGKRFTENEPVRPVVPGVVVIPTGMHIGAPSAPCVQKGDVVKVGQVIAEPVGGLGIPVHSSVSGTVTAVEERQQLRAAPEMCIEIESDMLDEWVERKPLGGVEDVDPALIIPAVKAAGICGMGGASFPTHVKMSVPEGKSADIVILNGAECEPYLTADYRNMVENPERIVDGLRLIMRATGVERGVIAIENNKPEAIRALEKATASRPGCEVMVLKTKYPQGGEKQLIHVVTGREVPRGKLPIEAHALVFNVSTAKAVADAILDGTPLIERITTVTGNVNKPSNLLVRVGTRAVDAIEACGGLKDGTAKVFFGGPMTGLCVPNLEVSIAKNNNGLIAFDQKQAAHMEEGPCIRCGRCIQACALHLLPYELKFDTEKHDLDAAKGHGLMDCVLCGACTYMCPAHRPLTPSFKTAKDEIAAKARR